MSPSQLIRELLAPQLVPNDAELDAMLACLRPASFAAGASIYRQGWVAHDIVLMETGLVRAYYVHGGRDVNLRLLSAPSVAATMTSLITGEAAQEWVEAINPVVGYRADLEMLARSSEKLAESIHRLMAEQHYLALERRLRMLQHKSVAERYAYFCEHMEQAIVQTTPGYHVASYLGVSPETLSRVRRTRRS
ncbi:MAG: Crp/Fnr family transcriptional regulator [Polyangiales bacterium]